MFIALITNTNGCVFALKITCNRLYDNVLKLNSAYIRKCVLFRFI